MSSHITKQPKAAAHGLCFSLVPAVSIGFEDSITPCAIVTLIFFLMLLSRVAITWKRVLWLGIVFVVSVIFTKYYVIFGLYDNLLGQEIINEGIRAIYLLVGLSFMVLGILHFMDWWRFKKSGETGQFLVKLPPILKTSSGQSSAEQTKRSRFKFFVKVVGLTCFFMVAGAGLNLLSSVWSQDYVLFMMFYYLFVEGKRHMASLAVTLSVMIYALPLLIAWIGLLWLARSQKGKRWLIKAISSFKLICCAILLTTGVGLIIAFL